MHAGSWRSSAYFWVALLWWGLAGCVTPGNPPTRILRAGTSGSSMAGGESTGQPVQGYTVPGRAPGSQMPWEFFLGNAAHRLIAYMYKVNHPERIVHFNSQTLLTILEDIGDLSLLLPHERALRPDIADISIRHVFEIKPWNETALQEGRQEVRTYLAAMNRALRIGRSFTGGVDFQGEMLIRFAQGQYIWRLEWRTTEPGVTQYRWTRSQQRFASAAEAADAGRWVNLTEEEMRQYGGWVGQAVEGMVSRRERLATVSGAVGLAIDILGEGAMVIITGAILGRMRSNPGAWPPAQGGGQVIPFPVRPAVPTAPAQVPAAAMGQ
jgi:hypothetical protein